MYWQDIALASCNEHFRYFELLINAPRYGWSYSNFKIWPTLWPADVTNDAMNTDIYIYEYSHNSMMPMYKKFNDDFSVRFLVIMKNILISFTNEYRGPNLWPYCDFIDDVIAMKYIFGIIWDELFISEIKMKLCLIFQNILNGHHFEVATYLFTFLTGSNTGSW